MTEKLTNETTLIRVSREHHRLLRIIAANHNLSMGAAAERAIEEYCRRSGIKVLPIPAREVTRG